MSLEDIRDVVEVDAKLDELVSPSSSQVWHATRKHGALALAAAAARRALEGGVGGGGLVPSPLTLGPYTIDNTDSYTAPVDLGANTLGIIKEYALVVTALNFDGGDPSNGLAIDFDGSLNGTTWLQDGSAVPDRPNVFGLQPAGFQATGTLRGNIIVPRYTRMQYSWGGDQGANAAATFHVDLTYF